MPLSSPDLVDQQKAKGNPMPQELTGKKVDDQDQKRVILDARAKRAEQQNRYIKKNPWYVSFSCIRGRTQCKTHKAFPNYGGRGIKCLITCEEVKTIWYRDGADNMTKPSIDRIDNNGDYTFANCRFIELSDNIRRMRIREVSITDQRRCKKCRIVKPIEMFHRNKPSYLGRLWTCTECSTYRKRKRHQRLQGL